jgi:hypothetical protein
MSLTASSISSVIRPGNVIGFLFSSSFIKNFRFTRMATEQRR